MTCMHYYLHNNSLRPMFLHSINIGWDVLFSICPCWLLHMLCHEVGNVVTVILTCHRTLTMLDPSQLKHEVTVKAIM